MSIQGLQTPFERLAALPTTMNWRGTWDPTESYFQNDVVVSPINVASYILPTITSIIGGSDPSTSADWAELSPLSTGVLSVTGGVDPGIRVDNTDPQQPVIFNTGVITVTAGDGINVNDIDPQNLIITSTAINGVQAGSGIQVLGSPQLPLITNLGVLQLTPGNGIGLTASTGTIGITNTGLITALSGEGIDVGTNPHNLVLTNKGVVSLTVSGNGLTKGGDAQNPTLTNTGVLGITPADPSIVITGTPQNPVLSCSAPQYAYICGVSANTSTVLTTPFIPNTLGYIVTTLGRTPSIFKTYLATGPPTPTSIFLLDMTAWSFFFTGYAGAPVVVGNEYSFAFNDTTTAGGPYTYSSATVLNNLYITAGQPYSVGGFSASLGFLYFDVTAARAAGLRTLDSISILNSTNASMISQAYSTTINGWFYPLGLE